MMILLFSSCKAWFIGCEALVLLFVMTRIYDGASVFSVLLLFALGSLLSFFGISLYATAQHHRLLLLLYSLQRPADFIRMYEPLLDVQHLPANLRFTLTAYLSNGYAAKGDFEKARYLLAHAPAVGRRQAENCEIILCENLASIALAERDTAQAKAQVVRLQSLITSGRLNSKKKAEHSAILKTLQAELNILQQEITSQSCDLLRAEIKKTVSPLRKTELGYYIGIAYSQLGENRFAREYLTPAAENREVCYGRLAARALRDLPDDRHTGDKKKK